MYFWISLKNQALKNLLAFTLLFVITIFSACNKFKYETPLEDSSKFVGEWTVTEYVSDVFISHSEKTYYFTDKVVALNDTTAGFLQTSRKPAPDWVGSGGGIYTCDTMYMEATKETMTLIGQGTVEGTYNSTFDTVYISYRFGGVESVYDVQQVWIRKQ